MNPIFCKHLRTKRMYVDATPEEAFAEKTGEHVTPCHYWCNQTQTVVGLDDRPVHAAKCVAPRPCFEE